MDEFNKEEHSCGCYSNFPSSSVHQTLDELDFSRGIWSAALDGDLEGVRSCLEKKHIPVDSADSSGYTALHYACRNGHLAISKLLLNHQASPNIQTRSGGVTALHRAAYCGHGDIVRLLLDHGANPLLADSDNKLPIHKAAERNHTDLIRVLVKASPSSKTLRDSRGRLPIDCVTNISPDLINLLQLGEAATAQSIEKVDNG